MLLVAIHWRTERVPSRFFPACTKSLISTLSQIQREYPAISNVYLLTDYPLESLRGHEGEVEPHSASYGYLPQQVSKSMRVLVDWIKREGSKLELTTWTQEEDVLPFANVTRELLPVGTRLKDLDLSFVGAPWRLPRLHPCADPSALQRHARQERRDERARRSSSRARKVCVGNGTPVRPNLCSLHTCSFHPDASASCLVTDTSSVVAQRHLARGTGDADSIWNDVRFF